MNKILWGEKPYYSLDYYLKQTYGQKIYKLSLNGGMSCPNRDGSLGTGGCIFCSKGGSGDFAQSSSLSITKQIEDGKLLLSRKLQQVKQAKFIAYFQAFTNTYGPVEYLRKIFLEAINHPDIMILSIATRPDCLGPEVIELLKELNEIKPVWVELGLQTIHEPSALFIRRGYPLSVFEDAVNNLSSIGIPIIVHTILGLPKESKHDMLKTMEYLGSLPIQGVKLQLLHILKDTDLGNLYLSKALSYNLTIEQYLDYLVSCLEMLPGDLVIHRITGDGPKDLLLAPMWSSNKKLVLNSIHKELKLRNTWQGKYALHNITE